MQKKIEKQDQQNQKYSRDLKQLSKYLLEVEDKCQEAQ